MEQSKVEQEIRKKINAILEAGDMFLEPPDDLADFIDKPAIKKSRVDQILAIFPEWAKANGYFQEKADWIGGLLRQGWIPPEEVKDYVKLAEGDKVICKKAWDLLSPVIREGLEVREKKTGWRKVKL